MTKDEALQMCLEYIETNAHERKYVRHAIKQALAAPVQNPITEEMHIAAVKVLHRANGVDGLPQRMLDAMLAAQLAQPAPVQEPDRVRECAQRLVEHADFRLGGVLSADSKAKDIPSKAVSQVKARHLASLRDALAATPPAAPVQEHLSELEKDAANLLFALHDAWPYVHRHCTIESKKKAIQALIVKHGEFADLQPPAQPTPVQGYVTGLDVYLDPADMKPKRYPPAQPAPTVQEPVYLVEDDFGLFRITTKGDWNFYNVTVPGVKKTLIANATPPAQRQWVGLTDEEWQDFSDRYGLILFGRFKNAIEAKLKEKNNG